MAKKALVALAALAALLAITQSAQAEANLEITAPADDKQYTTTGSLEIVVSIRNNGPNDTANVRLSLDIGGGVKYSAGTIAALESGQTRDIRLRVTGQVDKSTDVMITAYASGADEDRIFIVLLPPKAELKIESPIAELSLVGVPENGSAKISVAVKNWGEAPLSGVALTFERVSAGLSCTTTGPQDIGPRKTASYSVTCSNISSGKSFRIGAADAQRRAFDTESITLRLVEQMLPRKLEILSPLENAELRLPKAGGVITMLVKNNGLASLTGVCAFAGGIEYNSGKCADMVYNKTAAFNITLFPAQELTLARLIVNDSHGKAQDEVVVRVLRVQAIQQAGNQTADYAGGGANGTNGTAKGTNSAPNATQNASSQGSGGQDQDAPMPQGSGPFGLPQDFFNILIIAAALAILGVYVKIAVSRANKN